MRQNCFIQYVPVLKKALKHLIRILLCCRRAGSTRTADPSPIYSNIDLQLTLFVKLELLQLEQYKFSHFLPLNTACSFSSSQTPRWMLSHWRNALCHSIVLYHENSTPRTTFQNLSARLQQNQFIAVASTTCLFTQQLIKPSKLQLWIFVCIPKKIPFNSIWSQEEGKLWCTCSF